MNSFERKIILILSALLIALASLNLYLHAKDHIRLKLVESSSQVFK